MNDAKILILSGDGINCERETKFAFDQAGGTGTITHINDLMSDPSLLDKYDAMAIPGGFSFGDELGSGQILALKIRHGLLDKFKEFVTAKKPIIGICNGFQVLVKLGIISTSATERTLTLTQNLQGEFIDKWVELNKKSDNCIWTKNLPPSFELPIRHGEGRVELKSNMESEIYQKLVESSQVVLTYTDDINGSYEKIAGLCDETGLIFGLMPHPEAYLFEGLKPGQKKDVFAKGIGQHIFGNAINYIKSEKANV